MLAHVRTTCAWTLLSLAAARAQTTSLASVPSGEPLATPGGSYASISRDSLYVAYASFDDLEGDTNGQLDVYLYDRQAGTKELVSVRADGVLGNAQSNTPAVSGTGRFVAFRSSADNLVPGDLNGVADIFVKDRLSGAVELVSISTSGEPANAAPQFDPPGISPDGRFVVYTSVASNLVAGDTNGYVDVFLRDRLTGTTERVSVGSAGQQANTGCLVPTLSDDGRFVAFASGASTFVPGDTTTWGDIYLRDRQLGTTVRISAGPGGVEGNGGSGPVKLSSDGRFVAFVSGANNLVSGDTNGFADVFVHDRDLGVTEIVSRSSAGALGNHESVGALSISPDGRWIAFPSRASNFVPGDAYYSMDVFLHDRQVHLTELVSLSYDGQQAWGPSYRPSLSGDPRLIVFQSASINLVPGAYDGVHVYVRDRGPGTTSFCTGEPPAACPCGNAGLPGRGCDNSAATGGAMLQATGSPSLAQDSLHLVASGLLASAFAIVVQADAAVAPQGFGDGLSCLGTVSLRLYAVAASGGGIDVPRNGQSPVSVRSALLGDPIPAGASRAYQVIYRDPHAGFCPPPLGGSWNTSSALTVVWTY